MVEILLKKRDGFSLTEEEIAFIIKGIIEESIPNYQLSAFTMVTYFKGMSD